MRALYWMYRIGQDTGNGYVHARGVGAGDATAEVLMHRLAMAAIGALLLLWVEAAPATAQPTEEPGGPAAVPV
jgi:hypothetical protein